MTILSVHSDCRVNNYNHRWAPFYLKKKKPVLNVEKIFIGIIIIWCKVFKQLLLNISYWKKKKLIIDGIDYLNA